MLKARWMMVILVLGLALVVPSAKADALGPGGSGPADAFVLGYSSCPGVSGGGSCVQPRTVLSSNLPFGSTWGVAPFSGSAYEQVESDPTNVFCSGCLDFLFQVSNNVGSNQNITRVDETGFGGYLTDVGYDSVSLGSLVLCGIDDGGFCNNGDPATVPATVDRSLDGNTVGFNFPVGASPNENTVDIVIETNATSFADPVATIYGSNGGTGTIDIYGPSGPPVGGTPTPEPSTGLLLGAGLLGLLGLRKVNIPGKTVVRS
jgi:hypothetical protein